MKSLQWLDRRIGYIIASVGILFGIIAPSALPVFASAAALDSRSITMSSAAAGATGVSYELKATTGTDIDASGGLIVQFCSDSPLVGTNCTAPTMSVASVSASGTTAGTASDIDSTNHAVIKWVSTSAITAGTPIDIIFSDLTNPSGTPGTFYARVTTYTNSTNLGTFDNTTPGTTPGTYADEGGVALSTASTLGITAYVQESMSFCVANIAPQDNCGGIDDTNNPSMTLGETVAGSTQKVLDSTKVSTGEDYAQLSTNAAHGAVVNLHSSTTGCGGLVRVNDTVGNCDIKPQNSDPTTNTIAAGNALFGLTVGTTVAAHDASDQPVTGFGTLQPSGSYNGTNYFLDYTSGDTAGVTSTYGSALFDSNGGPVSGKNVPVTFGVSAAANTPAGIYSATLNMIAVGTF